MHEYLKEAREGAAKKLKGIQDGEPRTKVDSSSWSPPEMLEADKQNGMRPVSPRQYKSGGKVAGIHAKKRADRKARKEGGRAMSVDGYINRDMKMANDEREGVKKIGGMKRGGKAKREHHANGDPVGDLIRQDQIEQGMKGRGLPMRVPMPPRRPKASAPSFKDPIPNSASPTFKKGGATHPDVAEDKALIKKMVKPSARTGKAEGGQTEAQRVGSAQSKFYEEGRKPAVQSTKLPEFDKMRKADRNLTAALDQQGYKKGGRTKHASGGEAGRGLYVRQGYPHEVPGVDGGRIARAFGGKAKGKGKTNIHINVMPHGGAGQPPVMPPMGGPIMPPPPPPRPPMPPMDGMPMGAPMGGPPPMPPMGAGRPGMPPIGRKHGGEIPAGMKTMHVIDNAAGGGLGRIEKIKAYGLD